MESGPEADERKTCLGIIFMTSYQSEIIHENIILQSSLLLCLSSFRLSAHKGQYFCSQANLLPGLQSHRPISIPSIEVAEGHCEHKVDQDKSIFVFVGRNVNSG